MFLGDILKMFSVCIFHLPSNQKG